MRMRISQGGIWHLGRYMAGWSGVLEPKRGLPREKGDAQLNKQNKQTIYTLNQLNHKNMQYRRIRLSLRQGLA
jgi:hypothetical protein